MCEFDSLMDENCRNGLVVVASGLGEYNPRTDYDYKTVFNRADYKMYERKRELHNTADC